MPKKCAVPGCTHNVFSKKHCLWHQYIVNPPKPIPKVGPKKAKEKKLYRPLNREFLGKNKKCAAKLIGCQGRSTQVHHIKGCGKYFLDVSTWMAICESCHDKIHNKMSMDEAVRRGLRIKQN